jgi:hypothetical protein
VAKHFELLVTDASFTFARKHEAIAGEAALDGIYIIRTSLDAQRMDAPDCVRNYKALPSVERAFRSLKTVDLHLRPIHHRTADRARAHILNAGLRADAAGESWRGGELERAVLLHEVSPRH